jgi:ribulose-phosphate 3-epimerase
VLDVHLLVERPERYAAQFVEAGAERLAVHPEATPQLHRVLDLIRTHGARAGVALNPATTVESVTDVLEEIDFLTVLAADPGTKEEVFIPRSIEKIRTAWRTREDRRLDFALQAEGAIGLGYCEQMIQAGADILVAGSTIFHSDNPKARLTEMIRLAFDARQTSKV